MVNNDNKKVTLSYGVLYLNLYDKNFSKHVFLNQLKNILETHYEFKFRFFFIIV